MEKKHKIMQVYAVIICVVAVITFLISVTSIVSAFIDRSDPIHAWRSEVKLSSFENFKMDVLKSTQKDQAYIPDDTVILKMYESAKNDKILNVMHRTNNTITVSAIVIVICLFLFISHWILLKKITRHALNP
jgi:hypothetical protein